MVNRKFTLYGQVTSDPSQVRVEIVTSDSKTAAVMSKITTWKSNSGKATGGADNDVFVTPLTGGSGEYINFVLKQTSGKADVTPLSQTPLLMGQQALTQDEAPITYSVANQPTVQQDEANK